MADWLRRLLYPLVLPLVVATVWACGWVRRQEDTAAREQLAYPPIPGLHGTVESGESLAGADEGSIQPRAPSDFFATAAVEEISD